jgi:hypothetical protein
MSNSKNKNQKNARKKVLDGVNSDLEAKGDVKNTLFETGKDLLVGGIGGGLVGTVVGRLSLAIGAVVTGIGHYTNSRLASIFGVGMMAGGAITPPSQAIAGKEEGDLLEGIKDRALSFKDNLLHRTFLDNVLKSKQDTTETEQQSENDQPVGEIKYFVYPGSEEKPAELEGPDLDLTALDRYQQKVITSAENFKQAQEEKKQEVSGDLPEEVSGEIPEPEMGDLDPEDKNY